MFEKIVLASGNAGKLKEFARLFADLNIEVLPQSQFNTPECPEPYHTFVYIRHKARAQMARMQQTENH